MTLTAALALELVPPAVIACTAFLGGVGLERARRRRMRLGRFRRARRAHGPRGSSGGGRADLTYVNPPPDLDAAVCELLATARPSA